MGRGWGHARLSTPRRWGAAGRCAEGLSTVAGYRPGGRVSATVTLRANALFEVLAVTSIAYLTRAGLHHFGAGFASGALATVVAVAIATVFLHRRDTGWRELGCRRPQSMRIAAIWTLGLFLADMLLIQALVFVLANALHLPAQRLEAFDRLRGNLALYLELLVPITWGTAAFGEELIFRGFMMRRLTDALGSTRRAELGAVVGQATLFGFAHAYLGPRGMLKAGVLGLFGGLCYRWNGRNLWPLFIAHGLVDSVGLTVLFLGMAHS